MIQVSNHFLPYLLLCPTFLCIKKFRMMSMIQARAPLQYGIISTTTMRKNQSTNKKTSCYYYESLSIFYFLLLLFLKLFFTSCLLLAIDQRQLLSSLMCFLSQILALGAWKGHAALWDKALPY